MFTRSHAIFGRDRESTKKKKKKLLNAKSFFTITVENLARSLIKSSGRC